MKTELIIVGGVVLVGGYFVYKAISKPTDITSGSCAGDWTDYINPACWYGGASAEIANASNAFTNELNTILIIVGLVVVAIIGLLAFGPQTEHIARGTAAAFI